MPSNAAEETSRGSSMSKHFELMKEVLREPDQPIPSKERSTLFPAPAQSVNTPPLSPGFNRMAQEECLKLVQRIFLSSANTPRAVVFAGVDAGVGCSRICVETARILAANTSSPI